MNLAPTRLLTMSVALVVAAAASPAAAFCPGPRDATSRLINEQSVRDALPSMLAREGLPAAASPASVVRRVELDGDPSTEEALVDVIAPELCGPSFECPTIAIVARSDGLWPVAHGVWMQTLQSRTAGWMDLGETGPSLIPFVRTVTRALHWTGRRYSV